MKIFTSALFLSIALMTQSASAQIPTGNFSGYISNNPFSQWCQLNRAEIQIQDSGNQHFEISWRESGFAPGSGFCQNDLDASFTPTGYSNEWDVNFYHNFDLVFGRAALKGNVLEITASYNASNPNLLRLNTRLTIGDNGKSINYFRRIETWSGPTLYANGNLSSF